VIENKINRISQKKEKNGIFKMGYLSKNVMGLV